MSIKLPRKLIGSVNPVIAHVLAGRKNRKPTPVYIALPEKIIPPYEGWQVLSELFINPRFKEVLHVKLHGKFAQLKQSDKDFGVLKSEIEFLCSSSKRKIVLEMPYEEVSPDIVSLLRKYKLVLFFPYNPVQAKALSELGFKVSNNMFDAAEEALKPAIPTQ